MNTTAPDAFDARSQPIIAADKAAQAIFLALDPDQDEGPRKVDPAYAESWPRLGAKEGERIHAADIVVLAGFVRANADAPAEALYRQAGMDGIHRGPANGFAALPLHVRVAFETFRQVLLTMDRVFREEEAKRPKPPPAARAPVPIEDTILEELDDPLAPVSWAKPKPAKQTPRKGGNRAPGWRGKGKGGK